MDIDVFFPIAAQRWGRSPIAPLVSNTDARFVQVQNAVVQLRWDEYDCFRMDGYLSSRPHSDIYSTLNECQS